MGRTFLSAAVAVAFVFRMRCRHGNSSRAPHFPPQVKGGGQECPPYTTTGEQRLDNSRLNMYYPFVMNQAKAGKRRAPCPEEAAFLDQQRTCDLLSRGPAQILKAEDLSATQYNVLRILRGSPEGLPCGEIASRMITRDPDITRLLDRLEKRGLITRRRETRDRRMVTARIAPDGLKLLALLDEPVQDAHRRQLGHLGKDRLHGLAELLEAARANVG